MPLEARSTRRPGDKGTKRWLAKYGDRLLFVRYRYDTDAREMLTTVELIVGRRPAPRAGETPPAPPEPSPAPPPRLTGLRIAARERWLHAKARVAGGYWDPQRALWIVPTAALESLGLRPRVVPLGPEDTNP
jgi:hypothetical protein